MCQRAGSVYNSLDELSKVAENLRKKEGYYSINFFMTKDFNWKNFTAVFPELPENVLVNIIGNITSLSSFDSSTTLNTMCFSGGEYFITGLIRAYTIFLTKEAHVQIHDVDPLSCISMIICSDNSRLKLYGCYIRPSTFIKLYNNSCLSTRENAIVEAYDKSTVQSVGNSTIKVHDKARIEANNGFIYIYSNDAILKTYSCNITIATGCITNIYDVASTIQISSTYSIEGVLKNSKIICYDGYLANDYDGAYFDPRGYINSNGIYYKCVKKRNGRYYSFYDDSYEYEIGKFAIPDNYNSEPYRECAEGIHIATIEWALEYYFDSKDCAILEVKVPDDAKIVAPYKSDGKLRASKVEILREVSLDEFGELGRFYKKFARIED
jgi:hypothetical protein